MTTKTHKKKKKKKKMLSRDVFSTRSIFGKEG